ncbi:MAG TPA: LptA/OstA family protein [Brevundimonas sp.]|uniref:LptA/OstA family protein n=1 Tax=Brevundimonas sp. TaxID=1871086 RepID=UPI002EDAE231
MKTSFGAATAALMLAAIPVSAQTPGSSSEAVAYGADAGEYTPAGFTLRGRAEVVQGRNRLRADAINGFVSDGDLRRVEASGNVYFVTPDQTMRGDRAVYTLASNEVVVTGDVILTQGQNVLTGGRLVYNTRTEAARMEGPANGRIRGVFYPQNSGN